MPGAYQAISEARDRSRASLILLHHHSSGDPTPSKEDLELSRRLAKSAAFLDLRLHDHVIIGNGTGRWISLAERGVL